jgi:hypothetical protein
MLRLIIHLSRLLRPCTQSPEPTRVVANGNTIRFTRGFVVRRGDIQNTLGVNVNEVVILRAGALTLIHLDKDTRVVVGVGRKDVRLLCENGCVAPDDSSHNPSGSLNAVKYGG